MACRDEMSSAEGPPNNRYSFALAPTSGATRLAPSPRSRRGCRERTPGHPGSELGIGAKEKKSGPVLEAQQHPRGTRTKRASGAPGQGDVSRALQPPSADLHIVLHGGLLPAGDQPVVDQLEGSEQITDR